MSKNGGFDYTFGCHPVVAAALTLALLLAMAVLALVAEMAAG